MDSAPQAPGLDVGDVAPDFALSTQNGETVRLSDFRGSKDVLLVFIPFAFSGICTGELSEIRDNLGDYESETLQVLAISCDSMFTLRAWADHEGYFFPLLSDFWPHGQVASAYGVFDSEHGMALRGTFLIDREGMVRWRLVNPAGVARDLSGFQSVRAAQP